MNEMIQSLIDYYLNTTLRSPIELFNAIVSLDFIPMHGPIHHFIDGAVLLTTYKTNGGNINLNEALSELAKRSMQMPLRYNNDKRKKPLFSRGSRVCRHLFNSFSKLKSDEKNIKKRRLFH